jgi:uncharacterized protein (UPF0332 family)
MSSESREFLRKAEARLEAAEELLRSRRYEDSVSRAYYCVLSCARAVLALKDSHPKTHEGTIRMFGELFVIREGWPKTMGSSFSRLKALRDKADYSPSIEATREDAEWSLRAARDFLKETKSRIDSHPSLEEVTRNRPRIAVSAGKVLRGTRDERARHLLGH